MHQTNSFSLPGRGAAARLRTINSVEKSTANATSPMVVRSRCALLCMTFYCAGATAAMDPTDVIKIEPYVSWYHDNNLFRLPDVNPALFGIDPSKKSDTLRILGLGLSFDKMISRQRLQAEANLKDTQYDKNTNLDYKGGDGRAAWMWQIGNYWSGEASYRRRRELGGFDDFRLPVRDIIDSEGRLFGGGYQFHPRWRASVHVNKEEVEHSIRRDLDYTSDSIVSELRYQTPAENSIGLQARRTDRDYANVPTVSSFSVNDAHRETRLNVVSLWQVTGAIKLDAQVGHAEVKHDVQSQRDFSGVTWRAAAIWDVSGKVRLNAFTFKDLRLYIDNVSSYQVVESVGISPMYAVTSKIVLRGDYSFERRDYRGDPGLILTNVDREDNVRVGRLAVTYSPIRNVDLSLSYESGDRRSRSTLPTASLNNYDYEAWFGTIKLGF